MRTIITVDGLAGSGKTTLSRLLAEKLRYAHLNSGLLYRAIGLLCVRAKVSGQDPAIVAPLIAAHKIELRSDPSDPCQGRIFIDNQDVTDLVRDPEVSRATSESSQHAVVRQALIGLQRQAFAGQPMVAEGRDMGTVVFPDAPLKFFVQADPQVRVARRFKQLYGSQTLSASELESLTKKITEEVLDRDKRDSERELSPTRPAEDAILIDNSAQTLTAVAQSMYSHVLQSGLVSR